MSATPDADARGAAASVEPPAPPGASVVHDLGYRAYTGPRRAPGVRWRVIARQQIASAWRTWWRFKSSLGSAAIITAIASGILLLAGDRKSSLGRAQSFVVTLQDTVLPESIIWFCRAGFVLTLTVTASIVASDRQSGAFTFYFARSVRPRDYVLGKLAGACVIAACIVAAGPVLIALVRLGLAETTQDLTALLPSVPKALLLGAIATLAYAAVPLGFSALVPNRRHALALWAAYYLIGGQAMYVLGRQLAPALAALDLPRAVQTIAYALFDLGFRAGRDVEIPLAAAIASLTAHVVIALGVLGFQVQRAQGSGVGGAA